MTFLRHNQSPRLGKPEISIVGLALVLACLLQNTPTHAQASISREEAVIQMTYAKLDYLSQLDVVSKAALRAYLPGGQVDRDEIDKELKDAKIDITLSDFRTGPLSEIEKKRWVNLVTFPQPPAEILDVKILGHEFTDADLPKASWQTVVTQWRPAEQVNQTALDQELGWTVEQVLKMQPGQPLGNIVYSRYVSYSVELNAKGKTCSYKAMFLFGTNSQGEEKAAFEDSFMALNGLSRDSSQEPSPNGLLQSHLRDVPVLAEWLTKHSVSGASCSTAGTGQLCCVGSRCGIPDVDMRRDLMTPLTGGWNAPVSPEATPKKKQPPPAL